MNDVDYDRYGIVGGRQVSNGVLRVERVVEKPGKQAAPSNLATVSGYLLTPDIFPYLEKQVGTEGKGELMIQPAMQAMIDDGKAIFAREIQNGKYYDTGDKLEYVRTVIDFALEREDIGPELRAYLQKRLAE
jgi:UTP--glucose-1-phosphate uridylyltransferase